MGIFDRLTPGDDADNQDDAPEQDREQLVDADDRRGDGPVDAEAEGEQLAEVDPRGESRASSTTGWGVRYARGAVGADRSDPPATIDEYWTKYYREFAMTRAALQIFDDIVTEPGYRISATVDGEEDDDMTEALQLWASNCAIHAGETGADLTVLLNQLPSKRRGKGTVFLEKVGTTDDPDTTAALMLLDPSTIRLYKRDDQNLLIQPDDDVDRDHPTTSDAEAAAYVQYAGAGGLGAEDDGIAFTVDDLVKLTFDADEGEAWGTSIFEALDDRIDSLREKLDDRDVAIKNTGHPHRIYSSENWSLQEAKEYATAHEKGEVSANAGDDDRGKWAGRVDFVNDAVEVTEVQGEVADLTGTIKDDIEAIFSLMPVSKFRISYADEINQFVVEPQQETDERRVDQERRILERKVEPIFQEKADELADGTYPGEISFSIEPQDDENPLKRESFPADNLESFVTAWAEWKQSGAETDLPAGLLAEFMGFDLEDMGDQYEFEADPFTSPGDPVSDDDGATADVGDETAPESDAPPSDGAGAGEG